MLRIPQIRKYNHLLTFEPESTESYRIKDILVIIQHNTSFISCYMVDFLGKSSEAYIVKYFMDRIIKVCLIERPQDTTVHLKYTVLTSRKVLLLNECLDMIYELDLLDSEIKDCILSNEIAAINYGMLIVLVDVIKKTKREYEILSGENILCYNLFRSKSELISNDKIIYITSETHKRSLEITYRIYINGLSIAEHKTNRTLRFVISNDRIFILRGDSSVESYQIDKIVEDTLENRNMRLVMFGNTLFDEHYSVEIDQKKGCMSKKKTYGEKSYVDEINLDKNYDEEDAGRNFSIKEKRNSFQSNKTIENSLLIRSKTLKFLSVVPLDKTFAVSLACQDSVFYYFPKKSFVSNELFVDVMDAPAFSIIQKSHDFFICIKEETGKTDNILRKYFFNCEMKELEDLKYFNAALNCVDDSIWDNVFVRMMLFLLFKWKVSKMNNKILSSFTIKILEYFDPARFQPRFYDEDFFDKFVVSHFFINQNLGILNEKALIKLLLIDFRAIDYEFRDCRVFYNILLHAYKNINCLREDQKYAITSVESTEKNEDLPNKMEKDADSSLKCIYGSITDLDQVLDFQNTLLKILVKNNDFNKVVDLISEDVLKGEDVVKVLLKTPLKKFNNKWKVARILIRHMKTHPLETRFIYSLLDYLKEVIPFVDLNIPEIPSRIIFLIYEWVLYRNQSSIEFMDLMFRAGRKDLGCILGYNVYCKTKDNAVLEWIRNNIGDYVFVYDGSFIGIENLP